MALQVNALTVTEITRRIKSSLETSFSSVAVQGEVSNFKRHSSGHMYFTLRDEGAQISAVIWRSRAPILTFQPEDGMKVLVTGRITLYEVRGAYQIEVSSIKPAGVGDLQVAFENLKRRLAAEGMFDAAHKKVLPGFPERIGVVTSLTGAAVQDILNVLRRRFPAIEVILRPTIVQGNGAAEDIAKAIEELNQLGNIDVMIVGRGGGSAEDLWAFNEEKVARAIFDSHVPVVSGVGHETDFTIADFVADLRAPTPSAAAELVVPDRMVILESVRDYWYTLNQRMSAMVNDRKKEVRHLVRSYSFNKPVDLLHQLSQRVDELDRTMSTAVSHRLKLLRSSSLALHHRITALDPGLVLRRGYAMIHKDQRIIDSARLLRANEEITIEFHDGAVPSKVS